MRVYRGEVYLVDFGIGYGSEQGGVRPAVIVQNNIGNKYSPTTIVVPVTSRQTKAHIPTHVRVKSACLTKRSLALTEQVVTIDKRRIIRKMGNIKLKSLFKILRTRINTVFFRLRYIPGQHTLSSKGQSSLSSTHR